MKISNDHVVYFMICFAVAFFTSCIESVFGATYCQSMIAGLVAGYAIGVGKEYSDSCTPGNKWKWSDIWVDMAGASFGATTGALASFLIT